MAPMGQKAREEQILGSILTPDEEVKVHIVERRLGGARLLEPAHVFATNERLIIIRRGVLGFHQDFKMINYSNITEIIVEHGIRFSKLHFSLQGEAPDPAGKKWLIGLEYRDALELVRYVNGILEKLSEERKEKTV